MWHTKISPVNFLLAKIWYLLQTDSRPYNIILKM